jgi:TRAP transporter 4TM/12TM fusion protein
MTDQSKVKKSFFQKNAEKEIKREESEEKKVQMSAFRYGIIAVLSLIFLGFELYIALVRPIVSQISYSLHLSLSLMIIFLYKPLVDKYRGKKWLWIFDAACIIMAAFIAIYFISNVDRLIYRIMMVDPMLPVDLIAAFGLLIVLLIAVHRTLGLALTVFVLFFVAYAFFGQYISGPFRYSGMTWQHFGEMLSLSPDGIYGSPLATCVTTIFYYFVFGAFFATCGGGQVLIDLGMKLSDKTAGGPAKASVVSSCLMGMVSGSAVANVTTTGVFTIPLMKKAGYLPEQAAAVESVSSTGGQIMPPIMGVGAFIMAEMVGIPYARIAVDALIPALGYYLAVFFLVHNIAKKNHLGGKDSSTRYVSDPILPRLYRLIPVVVMVVMIFMSMPLPTSALTGIALSIVIGSLSKETRLSPKQLLDCCMTGIRQAANIAIPTAACGIMIGIVVRSGAANKLTTIINSVGNSHLLFALFITMVGCLVLGMALPTVAAYLIANILFAETLSKLGLDLLSLNMFIFYFGVIAQITPPVCVASFTAAGIAYADSWKTGWTAFFYAIVSFIVPYAFIYQPAILLNGTVGEIIYACIMLAIAVFFLAGSIAGYLFAPIHQWWLRGLLFISGVLVAMPGLATDIAGYVLGFSITAYLIITAQRQRRAAVHV